MPIIKSTIAVIVGGVARMECVPYDGVFLIVQTTIYASSSVFFSSLGSTKGLHTTSHLLMGVPREWNFSS